jgi:hypothetical protein
MEAHRMALDVLDVAPRSAPTLAELVAARPVLTPRGQAALALVRFQRLWLHLGPADRAWFAGELAALAEEAQRG